MYPIKYGNNNNNAVIKVGIIPDEEAFFAKWIPKSCFLRANEVVKDANGDIALIFPKALSDDKYLKNIADKNKKYTEKIHLTLVHFKIKTLITGIKYNFSHNDLNTGNLLIMEDGHFKYTDYGISNIIENNQVSWRNQNKHISDYFDWQINLLKEYPIKKLLKKFKRKSKQLKSQENQSFANIKENAISILQEMLKPNLWKNDKGENLLLSPAEIIEIINEEQKNKHLKTG